MKLCLEFGIDSCVRLKYYTEPTSRNRGDNTVINRDNKNSILDSNLESELSRLRFMDSKGVDKLEQYDPASNRVSVVTRLQTLTEIDRLVKLRHNVPHFLVPPTDNNDVISNIDIPISGIPIDYSHSGVGFVVGVSVKLNDRRITWGVGTIVELGYKRVRKEISREDSKKGRKQVYFVFESCALIDWDGVKRGYRLDEIHLCEAPASTRKEESKYPVGVAPNLSFENVREALDSLRESRRTKKTVKKTKKIKKIKVVKEKSAPVKRIKYTTEQILGRKAARKAATLARQDERKAAIESARLARIEQQVYDRLARYKPTHKETKFGSHAKRSVREAGCVMDRDYQGCVHLVTLTLPSDGIAQFKLLARYSGYFIDRLLRLLRNISGCEHYYVWEFQKRGALHLHIAVAHHDSHVASYAATILVPQFYKILQDIGRFHNVDMFASRTAPKGTWADRPDKWNWRIDRIERSVANYLSKYLSKARLGFTNMFYPARWWGCCSSLRAKYKECRVKITISELPNAIARAGFHYFQQLLKDLNPAFILPYENHIYKNNIIHDSDGNNVRVPSDSILMSVWGCNVYFPADGWQCVYDTFKLRYGDGSNNFFNDVMQCAIDNDLVPDERPLFDTIMSKFSFEQYEEFLEPLYAGCPLVPDYSLSDWAAIF